MTPRLNPKTDVKQRLIFQNVPSPNVCDHDTSVLPELYLLDYHFVLKSHQSSNQMWKILKKIQRLITAGKML